jgi:hypothetical protein
VLIGWEIAARGRMGSYSRNGEVKASGEGTSGGEVCAVERWTACDRRTADLAAMHEAVE